MDCELYEEDDDDENEDNEDNEDHSPSLYLFAINQDEPPRCCGLLWFADNILNEANPIHRHFNAPRSAQPRYFVAVMSNEALPTFLSNGSFA